MQLTTPVPLALLLVDGVTASSVVKHIVHRRHGGRRLLARGLGAVDRPLAFHTNWIDQGGYFITVDIANCKKGNCPGGDFSSGGSSTDVASAGAPSVFNISYADGSLVVGKYISDSIRVGDSELKGYTPGLADDIQVSPGAVDAKGNAVGDQYGIMGVTFVSDETSLSNGYNFSSPTVPLALKQQRYIQSQSYSLYLDDIEADNSHVIFGGIDTAKYSGELKTLSVLTAGTGVADEQVVIGTGFSVTYQGQKTQLKYQSKYAAELDSGTAGWQMPESAFRQMLRAIPAFNNGPSVKSNVSGGFLVPCKEINIDASVAIQLYGENSVTAGIEVPFGNMHVPALEYEVTGNYNDAWPLILNGTEQCLFTVYPRPDNTTELLIGDPLFRSAYLFFNLDGQTISLAQASYSVDESNIVPVRVGNSSASYPAGSGSEVPFPSYTATASVTTPGSTNGAPSSLGSAGLYVGMVACAVAFAVALV